MVKKKLPKSSTTWVGCTNVTDRQTTDGIATAISEREREFTSAKKQTTVNYTTSSTIAVFHALFTLAASSGKRNVTVRRLFHRHIHRESAGGSMRCGQRTFREDRQTRVFLRTTYYGAARRTVTNENIFQSVTMLDRYTVYSTSCGRTCRYIAKGESQSSAIAAIPLFEIASFVVPG